MNVLDYGRSFLAGKSPWNSVRFWVESRTRVIDGTTGAAEDYYQCGACKSEDTFAEKDLFYQDNYDFLPVFGPRKGVLFRRKAYLDQGYRQIRDAGDLWEGQDYHIVERPDAELLDTNAAVREASAQWRAIVARTEISYEHSAMRAIIEYPVKTINIHHERDLYQIDTGPVAFPDLTRGLDDAAEGLSLAYVAFNVESFADFVIEAPTQIQGEGGAVCNVHHYSRLSSLPAKNTLWAFEA